MTFYSAERLGENLLQGNTFKPLLGFRKEPRLVRTAPERLEDAREYLSKGEGLKPLEGRLDGLESICIILPYFDVLLS